MSASLQKKTGNVAHLESVHMSKSDLLKFLLHLSVPASIILRSERRQTRSSNRRDGLHSQPTVRRSQEPGTTALRQSGRSPRSESYLSSC